MRHALIQSETLFKDCSTFLHELSNDPDINSILILSCDENSLTNEQYNELCCINKPLFGGIFPQIIYKDTNHENGVTHLRT